MNNGEQQSPTHSRADRLKNRSAERREAQRGRLRDLLLVVAEAQLLKKGYEAFSLREVAEATQYTPTTIYRHFRDRDALIEAVLQKWFQQFAHALENADHPDFAPHERMMSLGDAYLRFALAQPERYRVMFLDRPDIGVMPDKSAHLRDDPAFGVLFRACEALCSAGEAGAHPPMQVAMMVWLGLHGVAAMAVASNILDPRAAHQVGMGVGHALLRGLRSSD
ncbi:TetR/AcrR family transcriptional regulator [Gemmatimonas sp.]|jgi:AcrR family transcriptional regulator|uniref:TetR/AcrR family transcriptional regulator n=1 Tax=Gemmatimonas sp. TaxID=1962908 RepID=UPI0037C05D62